MNETIDIWRLYFVAYPHCTKLVERGAVSHENEAPYRIGRGVAFRVWRHRGFVVGWWGRPAPDEDTGLFRSLAAREMEARTDEIERWGGVEAYR